MANTRVVILISLFLYNLNKKSKHNMTNGNPEKEKRSQSRGIPIFGSNKNAAREVLIDNISKNHKLIEN